MQELSCESVCLGAVIKVLQDVGEEMDKGIHTSKLVVDLFKEFWVGKDQSCSRFRRESAAKFASNSGLVGDKVKEKIFKSLFICSKRHFIKYFLSCELLASCFLSFYRYL